MSAHHLSRAAARCTLPSGEVIDDKALFDALSKKEG